MKRYLVVFLAVIGLSSASAQSDPFAGGSLEFELGLGTSIISIDAQAGDYGLFDSFGARGTLGLVLDPDVAFKLAVDGLFPFTTNNPDLIPYAGAGLGVIFDFGTLFNIHALGGAEYRVSDGVGLFGEIAPGVYFGNDTDFGVGLRFGANFGL